MVAASAGFPVNTAHAHGGGLNAQGCQNDRKNGGSHCHRNTRAAPPVQRPQRIIGDTYFPNCDAVRSAGRAPIYRGEPGYAAHLDRDNDGIACEPFSGRGDRR